MLTKILIVDSNEEFRRELAEGLRQFYCVHACGDGIAGLEILRSKGADFLVMDLMLPGIDGLALLNAAQREGVCPPAMVCCVGFPPYAIQALQAYNVVYLSMKPCLIDVLIQRIRELVEASAPEILFQPATDAVVAAALRELGMNASRAGYHNCRDAILMLSQDPRLQVTKEIYPALGDWRAVEKNIRDAIQDAWDHRDEGIWRRYFRCAPNGQLARPSNKVFLITLAEELFAQRQAVQ